MGPSTFQISPEEIANRLSDASLTLLNVLPKSAFAEAHIPGSLNLPVSEIVNRAREILPDTSREIAVYCGSAS
jgi:phage shock protein E